MAGLKSDGVMRIVVLIVNVIYLCLGIAITAVGAIGFQKVTSATNAGDVMHAWNVGVFLIILFACGIATIVMAIVGFMGSFFKWSGVIKMYAVVVFVVVITEIAMGAYIKSLRIGDLRVKWFSDSSSSISDRVAYQSYGNCCGWDTWADSYVLYTPCSTPPTPPLFVNIPQTCQQSTASFYSTYLNPIAAAAITIACLELVTLIVTCLIMFTGKKEDDWMDAFHY